MKIQYYARKSLKVFYGLFPVRTSSDTNEKCELKLSHCETLESLNLHFRLELRLAQYIEKRQVVGQQKSPHRPCGR